MWVIWEKIATNLSEFGEKNMRNAEISSLSEMYFYTFKMNIPSKQTFYEILTRVENMSNLWEICEKIARNAEISSLSEMYFYTFKMNISSKQTFYEILTRVENKSQKSPANLKINNYLYCFFYISSSSIQTF